MIMMNVYLVLYMNYICYMVYIFIQSNHISRYDQNPSIPQSKQDHIYIYILMIYIYHMYAPYLYTYSFPRDVITSSLDHPQSSNPCFLENNVVSVPSRSADNRCCIRCDIHIYPLIRCQEHHQKKGPSHLKVQLPCARCS